MIQIKKKYARALSACAHYTLHCQKKSRFVLQFRMTFLKSFALAFSTFSTLPTPRVEWNEKNIRYMMCAFPFVGAVISLFCDALFVFAVWLLHTDGRTISIPLCALAFTILPVFVTGGIHLDGFMDTSDALGSHAPREKKLEILKDSRAGAFAVLSCVLYFLSYFVFSYELFDSFFGAKSAHRFENCFVRFMDFFPVSLIFFQSRLLSALSVATFPIAKKSGLVHTFKSASAKRFTAFWCRGWFVAVSGCAIFLFGKSGIAVTASSLAVFLWYFVLTKRNFGGITGDTAGFFVQMSELISLATFIFA